LGETEVVKAERKISRASSSIDRPWWTARILSRVFVFLSNCRIVSVAINAMMALLAENAQLDDYSDQPRMQRGAALGSELGRCLRLVP